MIKNLACIFLPYPPAITVRVSLAEALRFEAHNLVKQFAALIRVVVCGNDSLRPCAHWWRCLPEPAGLESRDNITLRTTCMTVQQDPSAVFSDAETRGAVLSSRPLCHPCGAGTPAFEAVRKRVKIHGRASGANTITRSVVRRPSAPRPTWGS